MQVSDIHIGEVVKKEFVDTMVDRINAQKPDLILLTGDIIDAPLKTIQDDVLALNTLQAKYGIYMILGNHEYYQGNLQGLIDYFKNTPIRLLINENVLINNQF